MKVIIEDSVNGVWVILDQGLYDPVTEDSQSVKDLKIHFKSKTWVSTFVDMLKDIDNFEVG